MNKDDMLIERIEGLKLWLGEKFATNEEQHNMLIAQTTKTNGRVNRLEAWQNKIVGGLIISQIVVMPILSWLVFTHMK